jgi:hypothetical protein
MAAKNDPLPLYEATRSLVYILTAQREMGRTPLPQHEDLLCDWLLRYYRMPDYRIDLAGFQMSGSSLAGYVGEYLGKYRIPQAGVLGELVAQAVEQGHETLQHDLAEALGRIGKRGAWSFAFAHLSPLLQGRQVGQEVRDAVVAALAIIYLHWPQEVAQWLENLVGATVRLEEVAHHPLEEPAVWRVTSDRIMRHILLHEPKLRCVVHALLDELPRANRLVDYLQYAVHLLVDLLFDERVPPNPYAAGAP